MVNVFSNLLTLIIIKCVFILSLCRNNFPSLIFFWFADESRYRAGRSWFQPRKFLSRGDSQKYFYLSFQVTQCSVIWLAEYLNKTSSSWFDSHMRYHPAYDHIHPTGEFCNVEEHKVIGNKGQSCQGTPLVKWYRKLLALPKKSRKQSTFYAPVVGLLATTVTVLLAIKRNGCKKFAQGHGKWKNVIV